MLRVEELEKVARQARCDFEARSVSRPLLKELYLNYNSTFSRVVAEHFLDLAERYFPRGNCGLASVYIQHLIGEGEVVRGSYNGEAHTVLLALGGAALVDITADQFGGPPIYVGEPKMPWRLNLDNYSAGAQDSFGPAGGHDQLV